MEPLDEAASPRSRVDPADIELHSTTPITINIAQLLTARAGTWAKLDVSEFERSVPLGDDPRFEPILALISRSLESAIGVIELPHLRVLVLLRQRDAMSAGELARLTNLRARPVFALLDSMEASRWIASDSEARGLAESITITQPGRNVVDSITERRQREIDEIVAQISEADRVAIARAFNSFATAAGEASTRKPKRGIAR